MFLKYRPAGVADIPAMLALASDRHWYGPEDRTALAELWQFLLTVGASDAWVMEDVLAPVGARLVHFGFTVFAAEEFADTILSLPPCLGLQILRAHQAGRLPLLSPSQLRQANAGEGITLLYPWFGMQEWVETGEQGRLVLDHMLDIGPLFALGYCLKRYYSFAYTPGQRAWGVGIGGRVLAEYGGSAWLLGATREDAAACSGNLVAAMFAYRAPRFGFMPGEQAMLARALTGETDEELAADMSVAIVTIRKRWGSIYARVAQVLPELLTGGNESRGEGVRGVEKKRRLLLYLRQHLEELRPFPLTR